ncbi:LysR family transcriptional regulator [Paludibacterium purpuratum]|uniref:LysR family transcriptional regulator n=1 Tax=Paludibacterium purpuratum TaxID=1144873 RepID=A0A4R7BAN9_9NEIS|nr:LysR family transcriptional regulator [Paludibacterium purpuratum]TDR81921.1 LysR family transcriptional regulator [Paludibacterium purpuratum]
MPMDKLNDLKLLVLSVELGSFSAAGRRLGLSPAAASAAVQRMEKALGARLFDRTTRQLRPTDAGERYIRSCQQALAALEDAGRLLQHDQGQVQGTLRISAPSDMGRHQLVDILDEYSQRYPDVRLVLTLTDALSHLVNDEQDIMLRQGPLADSSMLSRKLIQSSRVLCAAPDFLARHGIPATLDELAALPALVQRTSGGPRHLWVTRAGTANMQRYRESNDSEVIRRWALQGHGVAFKPLWNLGEDLAAGRLKLIQPEQWHQPSSLYALYHQSAYQPQRLRLFIELLAERLAPYSTMAASLGISHSD